MSRKNRPPNLDAELKAQGKINKIPPPEFSMIPMHSLVTFVGRRGSGKTYSATQLALMMKREGAINRIFIISPTYSQNNFLGLLEAKDEDVYQDSDNAFDYLSDIENKVEKAAELWKRELEYTILWRKWKKNTTVLTDTERQRMDDEGYRRPDPEGTRPNCLLLIDDCSHSPIFSRNSQNPMVNLALRHR